VDIEMKAGIAVDDWKLPVFRRVLDEAGYTYKDGGGFAGNCTMLLVETESSLLLAAVVAKANAECERMKK
jgi:hypothetical protein